MRLSVRKNDPGYRPDARGVKVFLDERPVLAITADEELGYVLTFDRDVDGKPKVDRSGPSPALAEKVLQGVVRIELPPHLRHLRSKQLAPGCRVHPPGSPALYR